MTRHLRVLLDELSISLFFFVLGSCVERFTNWAYKIYAGRGSRRAPYENRAFFVVNLHSSRSVLYAPLSLLSSREGVDYYTLLSLC